MSSNPSSDSGRTSTELGVRTPEKGLRSTQSHDNQPQSSTSTSPSADPSTDIEAQLLNSNPLTSFTAFARRLSTFPISSPARVSAAKTPSADGSSFSEDGVSPELDLTRVTSRLYASGMLWQRRTEKKSHRNNLHDFAQFLQQQHPGRYMIWNLGSTLLSIL
jgi:hypothetical protein